MMTAPIIIGIVGGSGSGKSWLAHHMRERFQPERAAVVEQDWYYRDLSHLQPEQAAQTNFDHPDALELDRLEADLRALAAGRAVNAPQYDFATFSRRPETRRVDAAPLIIAEGLFLLARPTLRQILDLSVYVDTPSDLRLVRRIRRDLSERGYPLERILDFWESRAHPMFKRFVEPQRAMASLVWKSLEDKAFVPEFMADLEGRLARNADKKPTAR